jgi:hypothetical protein
LTLPPPPPNCLGLALDFFREFGDFEELRTKRWRRCVMLINGSGGMFGVLKCELARQRRRCGGGEFHVRGSCFPLVKKWEGACDLRRFCYSATGVFRRFMKGLWGCCAVLFFGE